MPLKTPSFWYRPKRTFVSLLLAPVSWLYALGRTIHCIFSKPKNVADIHVICVGNINAGGAGKTPTARALMKLLKDEKLAFQPAFLMRGYKGKLKGPILVAPKEHTVSDVGEEALFLANEADVYIASNRYEGAVFAKKDGVDVLILDDGLQNRQLKPDTTLLVLDGSMGVGNNALIPAGPLREKIPDILNRIDATMIIGIDHCAVADHFVNVQEFHGVIEPSQDHGLKPSVPYFAFAGIGYPEKFYNTLKGMGMNVTQTQSFADHHSYSAKDIKALKLKAKKAHATLVTTEKDMLNLQRAGVPVSDIKTLPISLSFDNQSSLVTWLKERLAK